ncbi:hypothetical protein L9F63_027302, partial [Diploptera punctata]
RIPRNLYFLHLYKQVKSKMPKVKENLRSIAENELTADLPVMHECRRFRMHLCLHPANNTLNSLSSRSDILDKCWIKQQIAHVRYVRREGILLSNASKHATLRPRIVSKPWRISNTESLETRAKIEVIFFIEIPRKTE